MAKRSCTNSLCLLMMASVLATLLSGCTTYFTRKECERTNWFQHGYDVAMKGKRLDADEHVKTCQSVEAKMSWGDLDTGFKAGMAKYCTEDNVFAVGKSGKPKFLICRTNVRNSPSVR